IHVIRASNSRGVGFSSASTPTAITVDLQVIMIYLNISILGAFNLLVQ
ncbi:11821_t:CDS:1, partial [Entrophospora sp. SA101]